VQNSHSFSRSKSSSLNCDINSQKYLRGMLLMSRYFVTNSRTVQAWRHRTSPVIRRHINTSTHKEGCSNSVPTLLDTKNSKTFQDPRSIFQAPVVVSQQYLNISTNSSYGIWVSAVRFPSGVQGGVPAVKAFLAYLLGGNNYGYFHLQKHVV